MSKHMIRWGLILVIIITIVFTSTALEIRSIARDNTEVTSDESESHELDIVDDVIFPHDEVVDVNIIIDEESLSDLNEHAIDEEYYEASIKYNGYTVNNIAIRAKGNSSLQQVAHSDSDRYSFKVDFNYYLSDQSLLGITKINLNNIFSDDTLMAEYLGYEMLESIDAVCSRTTYIALSINGEYHGLYLAVEEVNESFLANNYDDNDGALYKPNMGVGSNLVYTTDNIDDYTDIIDETNSTDDGSDFVEFVKEIQHVLNGDGDLDQVFHVDSFLKYLAFSTATIHLDTYQSGMNHNYYLYSYDGVFEWVTWDLNMIFNGFPKANLTEDEAIHFLIDEPVIGSMDNYDLIEAIFMNEDYVNIYHQYLDDLIHGYLDADYFESRVLDTYDMIKSYANTDPTAFASINVVEESLFVSQETTLSLLDFVSERVAVIEDQLSGVTASTNNGQGNSGSGTMDGKAGMAPGVMGERPEGMEGRVRGEKPEGMEPPVDIDMPEGMEPPVDTDILGNNNKIATEESVSNQIEGVITILSLSSVMSFFIIFMKRR